MNTRVPPSIGRLDEKLPEGFFDSEAKSKKVQEDDLAKELEQFDREMAALEAESEQHLEIEFEKLQEEKDIDELDQQLERWKRIVDLEKRAEELQERNVVENPEKRMKMETSPLPKQTSDPTPTDRGRSSANDDADLSDIEDFEDSLFNWRSKAL